MLIWLLVSFAILVLYMGLVAAIVAGVITLLIFYRTNVFIHVFKPSFLAGSIGIFLTLLIGIFFETTVSKAFGFDVLWLIPVILMCIGLCIGTVRTVYGVENV